MFACLAPASPLRAHCLVLNLYVMLFINSVSLTFHNMCRGVSAYNVTALTAMSTALHRKSQYR